MILVQLKNNRVGRVGEVVRNEIEENTWNPLIARSKKYPDGRYGSRIAVRWDLNVGPLDPGTVVLLPEAKRLPSNVALPTVCPLKQELYESVVDAMNVRNPDPGQSSHLKNPLEGYRRLTFMMLDADIVAVSPASVWRVLSRAGLMRKWSGKPSKKGTGFEQPPQPHQHWYIDVSYLNVCATFYYLCSILDGYSRFLVHWDLRESMTEADIEIILEGAKERYPGVRPRVISDNAPQFIAKDFKEFIRLSGMTHVRT